LPAEDAANYSATNRWSGCQGRVSSETQPFREIARLWQFCRCCLISLPWKYSSVWHWLGDGIAVSSSGIFGFCYGLANNRLSVKAAVGGRGSSETWW
jgi:hypothetical protein